jgi:outer membrane receptor protein involved in Fe transport
MPAKWLKLDSSITLTQAKDRTTGTEHFLTYTPDTRWVSIAEFTFQDFSINLNLDYRGKQWVTPDNLIDPIPAITLVNSTLRYCYQYMKLTTNMYMQLNNLFDKQYEI